MIFFPAIDIKDGTVVRLRQGRADDETVFSSDPVAVAQKWKEAGAKWLHVVDLDGAFYGVPRNKDIIHDICEKVNVRVQLGGGIRDTQTAAAYFDAGVARLVIGTLAMDRPSEFAAMAKEWPNRIGVALDADRGKLKAQGWVEDTGLQVESVIPNLAQAGAAFFVYTDISRDGMGSGANMEAIANLAHTSPIPMIASGGINTFDDIKKLYEISKNSKLEGVISGRAIYYGTLNVAKTIAWLEAQDQGAAKGSE